jgi:hypothetical protein
MSALCFTCRTEPAGSREFPSSAYCPDCQPRDTRAVTARTANGCGACGQQFGGIGLFDAHQEYYPDGHRLKGVFAGRCYDPANMGLVQDRNGLWLTPAEHARRQSVASGVLSRT